MNTVKNGSKVQSGISDLMSNMRQNMKPVVKVDRVINTCNEGFARVVATVPTSLAANAGAALSAIAEKVGNRLRVIPNSFTVLASDSVNTTLTGVMTANPESVVYSEGMPGFRAVAGNMFLDDSENVWKAHKTEAGTLLIRARTRDDDNVVTEVMQSLSSAAEAIVGTSNHTGLINYEALASEFGSAQGGDFIYYVDPNKAQVVFGALAATVEDPDHPEADTLIVIASGDAEHIRIDRSMMVGIVEASEVEFDDTDLVNESLSSAGHTLEDIASYYSRVFQRDPSYFEKFMARWKAHNFG